MNIRRVRETLAEPIRVDILRLLEQHGPAGLPAGVIASDLEVLQWSLSAHLTVLLNAGLIECECRGRRMLFRADRARLAPQLLAAALRCEPAAA